MAGLAILAAAACTKVEKDSKPVQGGAVLTVNAHAPQTNQPETKVTLNPTDLIKWYSSDKSYAGLFSPGKGIVKSTSAGSSISEDGQQATFKFSSTKITSFESDAARIIYPCTEESSSSSAKFSFSVPASEQTLSSKAGSATSYGSSAVVPMISDAFAVKCSYKEAETYYDDTEWYGTASAHMHVLSSIVAFYVYDSEGTYSSEKVKSIELRSSSANISAPLSITLTADNELPVLEGTRQTAKVQFNYSWNYFSLSGVTSKEASAPIYLSIIPAEFAGKVIVKTDKSTIAFPFDAPKKFNRAEVKDFSLNLSNPKAQKIIPTNVSITNVNRAARTDGYSSGCKATITFKVDEGSKGFYAYIGNTQYKDVSNVIKWGEKYTIGEENASSSFVSLGNGVYEYSKNLSNKLYFAVLPFGDDEEPGIGEYLDYANGYSTTKLGDVEAITEDISKFNN